MGLIPLHSEPWLLLELNPLEAKDHVLQVCVDLLGLTQDGQIENGKNGAAIEITLILARRSIILTRWKRYLTPLYCFFCSGFSRA